MKRASTISLLAEFVLRFVGMWPHSAYPDLYWWMYVAMMAMFQCCQYSYIIAHFDLNNLSALSDCLSLAFANSLALLKILALGWNRRIFYNILKAMDRDWSDCVIRDSYRIAMITTAELAYRCTIVLVGMTALSGFFLSIGAYMIRTINSDGPRELPVKMTFPFEINESPLFNCILAGQIFYEFSSALVVGMINALLATLVLHVGGQIDIMRQAIMEISKNDEPSFTNFIKGLICKHRNIITLSEDIDNFYSSIALMQLLWNTLIICFAGFMIIVILSSNKGRGIIIKFMILYTVKTLEVFVFCYAGEFLSAKSKSISDALYESFWYNMLPSDCRVLLFIMMRSQKRLTITAGKIFDLTLEGFMSVMKASASYMSVLHASY